MTRSLLLAALLALALTACGEKAAEAPVAVEVAPAAEVVPAPAAEVAPAPAAEVAPAPAAEVAAPAEAAK